MKRILLVFFIASLFILYLFQHRYSVLTTQQLAKLEKQKQLLKQELILLEGEKTKTFLYSNLEDSAVQLNLLFPKNIPHNNLTANKNHGQITNLTANEPNKD
jgi:hypothetical protein